MSDNVEYVFELQEIRKQLSDEVDRLRAHNVALMQKNLELTAKADALVKKLSRIALLQHPKDTVLEDGTRMRFKPPDELVRETWEYMSQAIRDLDNDKALETTYAEANSDMRTAALEMVYLEALKLREADAWWMSDLIWAVDRVPHPFKPNRHNADLCQLCDERQEAKQHG